jgi:hypothetical protein
MPPWLVSHIAGVVWIVPASGPSAPEPNATQARM